MSQKEKQKSLVVFDVSDYSIELLETTQSQQVGVEVLNKGRILLEEGIIKNAKVENVDKVLAVFKKLIDEAGIMGLEEKDLIMILPSSQLYYQVIEIKRNAEKPQEEIIKEKLQEYAPIEKNDLDFVYRCANLARVTILRNKKDNLKKIFTVSYRRSLIDSWQEVFEKNNLKFNFFEIDSFAQFYGLNLDKQDKTYCLIDFGARNINVLFWQRNKLRFAFTYFEGSENLTKILADELNVSLAQAEEIKKESGLLGIYDNKNIREILNDFLFDISNKLKKDINYYEENYISFIDEIILVGGGSKLKGLINFFKEQNIKDCVIRRLDNAKKNDLDDVYLNALGASIGFFENRHEDNLYISADNNRYHKRDFSKENHFCLLVGKKLSFKYNLNFKILRLKYKFYFSILGFVILMVFFSLHFYSKSKSDKAFLDKQVQIMEIEKILKEQKQTEVKKEKKIYIEIKPLDSSLRIRGGAGTNYPIVGKTESGERFVVLGEEGDWVKIEINETGDMGFVMRNFVDYIDSE